MSDEIKSGPSAKDVAEMNVAICEALGIDPAGIRSLSLVIMRDEVPRIEITYSARYINELVESMDDGTRISNRWCYEIHPLPEPELATPANGADWVDPTPHPEGMAGLVDDTGAGDRWARYMPTPRPLGEGPISTSS